MAKLTVNERELVYKFFDISGGYVLLELYRKTGKNKTWTQKLIYEATNVDIYQDDGYTSLSQQKAIEKIIEEKSSLEVADLLKAFYDYVLFNKQEYLRTYSQWCYEDLFEELSKQINDLILKLKLSAPIQTLPSLDNAGLRSLEKDLKQKLEKQEYDLAIDRLHTFSLFFLEQLCKNNKLTPKLDPKGHIMFDDMVSQLQTKFEGNNLLNNFDKETIKNSKIMLQKYNEVRNKESFAHPNKVIENAKAQYVVENIISLLNYLGEISKESVKVDLFCQCQNRSGYNAVKGSTNICWLECKDCGKIIENSEFEELPF